jgi:hypothetical protein
MTWVSMSGFVFAIFSSRVTDNANGDSVGDIEPGLHALQGGGVTG